MWAIPITALIIMAGLAFLQTQRHIQGQEAKAMDKTIHASGKLDKLREEFDEYKKRVDALVIRAGFSK